MKLEEVDNFGVQYFNKENADHLISLIEANYPVKTDWTGSKYIGIDLDWDYTKREVKLALKEYQHTPPPKPFDAPTKYHKPEFGQKIQWLVPAHCDFFITRHRGVR
jgi:hypothetical protein